MSKYGIIAGVIIFVLGILIIYFFQVDYPCTMSGCGCENIWQMLHDTWADLVGFVLILFSGACIACSLLC